MKPGKSGSNKRLRFEVLESRAFLSGTGAPDSSALAGPGFGDGGAASAFVGAQFPASPGSVQLMSAAGQLNGTATVAGDAMLAVQIALTADTGSLASASSLPGAAAQAQIQAQLQLAQQRSIGFDATTGVGQMLITTGSNTWGAQIWRADANETGR